MAALSFEESVRVLHRYQRVEARLFEILGGWVQIEPDPEVRRVFAVQAHHHGWHAQLWQERLPSARGAAPEVPDVVAPALEAFLEELARPVAPDSGLERLVGVFRVMLPHTITTYRRHLAVTSPVADGPVIRALRLALRDDLDDWQEGEALIQARVCSHDAPRRSAEWQARLEAHLVDAGGVAGSAFGDDTSRS